MLVLDMQIKAAQLGRVTVSGRLESGRGIPPPCSPFVAATILPRQDIVVVVEAPDHMSILHGMEHSSTPAAFTSQCSVEGGADAWESRTEG